MMTAIPMLLLAAAAAPASRAHQPADRRPEPGRSVPTHPPPRSRTPRLRPRSRAKVWRKVDATGAGVTIKGIGFGGAKVPAIVADAARDFLGQPASRENLGRLAKAMSDAYARSPVALLHGSHPRPGPEQRSGPGRGRRGVRRADRVPERLDPADAAPMPRVSPGRRHTHPARACSATFR